MSEKIFYRSLPKKIGGEQLRFALVQKDNGYFDVLDDYGTFMYNSRTCSTKDINDAIKSFENVSGEMIPDIIKKQLVEQFN